MKIIKYVLILIIVLALGVCTDKNISYANTELLDDFIKTANGEIVEYGVIASFQTLKDGQTEVNNILKLLGYDTFRNLKTSKNENSFSIDFNEGDITGFIEVVESNKANFVTVDIKNHSKGDINTLKNEIKNALAEQEKKINYTLYVRAKIENQDIYDANMKLAKMLQNNGAVNIDTTEISNGYSTVANTKRYEPVKSNGKYIDFNYALATYDTGNYLIIGSPIISEPY